MEILSRALGIRSCPRTWTHYLYVIFLLTVKVNLKNCVFIFNYKPKEAFLYHSTNKYILLWTYLVTPSLSSISCLSFVHYCHLSHLHFQFHHLLPLTPFSPAPSFNRSPSSSSSINILPTENSETSSIIVSGQTPEWASPQGICRPDKQTQIQTKDWKINK